MTALKQEPQRCPPISRSVARISPKLSLAFFRPRWSEPWKRCADRHRPLYPAQSSWLSRPPCRVGEADPSFAVAFSRPATPCRNPDSPPWPPCLSPKFPARGQNWTLAGPGTKPFPHPLWLSPPTPPLPIGSFPSPVFPEPTARRRPTPTPKDRGGAAPALTATLSPGTRDAAPGPEPKNEGGRTSCWGRKRGEGCGGRWSGIPGFSLRSVYGTLTTTPPQIPQPEPPTRPRGHPAGSRRACALPQPRHPRWRPIGSGDDTIHQGALSAGPAASPICAFRDVTLE